MSRPTLRPNLAAVLAKAAAEYQSSAVIPHCTACTKPCCKLDALVLELEWRQVRQLWKIEQPRAAFDQQLARGDGPVEIRAANGLYYIHSRPCPAYDSACGTCSVYGDPVKPVGCSDFPVYENDGEILADLRCEAVDLDALSAALARALGPDYRIVRSADREFPFLVSLIARRADGRRKLR